MKMELEILLKDEVFVDFFNTYLSLPVFGQTPLYMMNQNKWLMWPNVPFTQVNTGEFLKWLEMHRMVFFRRTELYHFFLLCTEILDFVSCKSTVDLKWTPADQWLVRKCLGSVRGIQRLRSFLKSSDEEELLLFCVRASIILRMKEEETEEAFQTLNRQALHTAIRRYDVTALLSRDCPLISQRRVLAEMKTKALNQLQSYWLPHFLHCCKSSMWRIPECRPVVEKYISICSPSSRSPSSTERKQKDPDITVHPARSYDSKRSKRHLWSSQHKPKNTHQSKSICLWLPPSAQTNLQCSNVAHPPEETKNKAAIESDDDANIHHTCIQTPACQIPFCVDINSPPSDIQFLQPALSAEGLSGGPFRYFLGARELLEERLMLDLLEDLDFFLLLLLKAQGEDPVCALRQTAARRITETYLKENKPRFIRHLDAEIRQNLSSLLPSSAALPWIYKAKYHLCKELREVYNSFLDADDEALLSLLSSDGNGLEDSVPLLFSSFGTETDALLAQTEALMLCEGCCARLDPADLNHDSWTLVALQDPHRGGSLLHKYNTTADAPEEPKPSSMTDTTQPAQDPPKSKTTVPEVQIKTNKKDNIFNEKPTTKPRSFEEVITSHTYFNHFLQFLQTQGADGALLFIQDAEALRSIEHKRQKAKIRLIVDKYFRRDDPADYLQCSADIITRVSQMDKVFPELIYTIQHLVAKSLEATWFRLYQDTFSVCPHASESDEDIKGPLLMGKLKANAWEVFISFIRSVIKFQSGMVNREIRAEFEDYLVQNYEHYSTPYVVRSKANHSSELSTDGEKYKPKIRCIMDKLVTVDFLVNDLCFYLECERFRRMADAGDKMVSEGLYSESDYAMLHHKAELIINIFLTSQISPKLLINSSEAQKEVVLQRFASGKVDRTLFYQPVVDLFPVLIFCWRKFCCLKVMRQLYPSKALMMVKSLRPLNLQQEFQIIRSTEVKEATLRFSSQHGLVLLLPQAN